MVRSVALSALVVVALGPAIGGEARAAITESTPIAEVETQPEPPKRWYGWQTALADVGTTGIAVFSIATEGYRNLIFVAAAGYLIAPPAIHLAHRNAKGAQWSGIMRLGVGTLALVTGFVISARTGASNDEASIAPTYITVSTMLAVPVVIDSAFFAFASVEEATMVVGARDGGFDLRLGGRF